LREVDAREHGEARPDVGRERSTGRGQEPASGVERIAARVDREVARMGMIPVRVGGLAIDERSKSPVVILQEIEGERVLPIWIGPTEATAIHMELAGKRYQRPLTHDLVVTIIESLKAKVSRVVITDLKDTTFFANIYLD